MQAIEITNKEQLELAFDIRKEVFVKEQGVAEEAEIDEYDQLDGRTSHVLVYYEDKPAGTGRVRIDGETKAAKLQRICVRAAYRKYGIGKAIMDRLEQLAKRDGATNAKLYGQTDAEGFYARLGYRTASDVFMEEGIPHVLMVKEL
ncbi:GNAT family N-acetyltransferase [Paenibacillus harenae]|uniref:GNAT family N-acetyltransferase n=1 Tax=Paenibacillus harenae TaxID=306543 RepID=UPI0027D8118B|nr:GNAT family N-acetyltransferase [Paenibacillus harenae]